jgi:ppGpp synthetase/RelA/SpoT-type nucleotidyltranferase
VQDITDDRWAVLQINNHPISVKYKVNGDITEVFTEELKSDFNSNVWFQQKFGKLEKFHEEVRSQLVQKIDKQEQLKIRLLTIRDITVVGQMITRS